MLAAGAAGAVRVDLQIVVIDLDVDILLDIRDHVTGRERCLALARRIERGDTHKPVYSFLRAEIPVGILPFYLKGHTLDPCHIPFQVVQDFHVVSFFLSPAGVHAVQHACPVAGLRAARPCVERHDRIVAVIGSREECTDPKLFKFFFKSAEFLFDLLHGFLIRLLLAHLDEQEHILIV